MGRRETNWNRLLQVAIAVALGWCFAVAQPVHAQNAATVKVPTGVAGYTVSINELWVAGHRGFTPIRVTVQTNPARRVTTEELFTVSVRCRDYVEPAIITTVPLLIPAGQQNGTATLYVDSTAVGNSYNLLCVERGRYDGRIDRSDLLQTGVALAGNRSSSNRDSTLLVVSTRFLKPGSEDWVCYSGQMVQAGSVSTVRANQEPQPNLNALLVASGSLSASSVQMTPTNLIQTRETLHGVHPAGLPDNWIGLTSVSQILISLADFDSICRTNEMQRSNLEKWVAAGGALTVFDTGPDFKNADQVWPLLLGRNRSSVSSQSLAAWRVPGNETKQISQFITADHRPDNYNYNYSQEAPMYAHWKETVPTWRAFESPRQIPTPPTTGNRFAISHYLDGKITVVNDDMSSWNSDDWRLLNNSIELAGVDISDRLGRAGARTDLEQFSIPGVGEPPILAFQVFIGMFLIVCGPVMLLVLKRTEQMQYLFIVVPALSVLVCISLFVYAILADGSNHWGRTQTVTTIDHRTNLAVTHSRSVYYSGRRPAPFQSPPDALSLAAKMDHSEPLFYRENVDGMVLSGGEMQPRSPYEIISVRSRPATQRLRLIPPLVLPSVEPAADPAADPPEASPAGAEKPETKSSPPSIQNLLGSQVLYVLLRTDEGLFEVRELADGATQTCQPIDGNAAGSQAAQLTQDLSPPGFYRNGYPIGWNRYGDQTRGEASRIVELIRQNDVLELVERPNSYVAILSQFPLAAEQIETAEYKLQLHVVRGQW